MPVKFLDSLASEVLVWDFYTELWKIHHSSLILLAQGLMGLGILMCYSTMVPNNRCQLHEGNPPPISHTHPKFEWVFSMQAVESTTDITLTVVMHCYLANWMFSDVLDLQP